MEGDGGLARGAADGEGGELSRRLSPGYLNISYVGGRGTHLENLQKIAQVVFISLSDHLNAALRQVAYITSELKALSAQRHEPPEADSLYAPADPCPQPLDQSATCPFDLIPA